jgi:hypothetical protein
MTIKRLRLIQRKSIPAKRECSMFPGNGETTICAEEAADPKLPKTGASRERTLILSM